MSKKQDFVDDVCCYMTYQRAAGLDFFKEWFVTNCYMLTN